MEFPFELRVCAWAEREWHRFAEHDAFFVARQLGLQRRRWDTVVVEADPTKLDARAAFGERALDSDLRFLVEHAPREWAYYRDCLPDPGYPWRYVREHIHRAAARDALEKRRNGNRIEIRRTNFYPEWVERVVAIENKPDLDASAARALADQMERDVALGLADEVWVATREAGERALLAEMPVEAGVLAFDDEMRADVAWRPTTLSPGEPGTHIESRADDGCEFDYRSPGWKRDRRYRIAERAYERGWRSYADTMRPDCRYFDLRAAEHDFVPYCHAKGREVTAAECSGSCGEFSPEPPAWRTKGWPIEGGPGQTVKRVLADQRRRRRPAAEKIKWEEDEK
ncbi:DUF5787 family protein [Halocalculus aciditolerans]|uniref:Uncharacterized protein n=1 Tax=Halocalculus aciditolerans TaxID=1383812 RepID=A0A830F4F1_9EURY|nr:DUF5787 family protein [Halocalculus aciditolerans]GGL62502.1 hypothetical protein GCM10009039_20680 [Halocalculus aciditolerans]